MEQLLSYPLMRILSQYALVVMILGRKNGAVSHSREAIGMNHLSRRGFFYVAVKLKTKNHTFKSAMSLATEGFFLFRFQLSMIDILGKKFQTRHKTVSAFSAGICFTITHPFAARNSKHTNAFNTISLCKFLSCEN